ncbi:SGNH/GDSL hydrolase family protein [Branchiibius sp. NY16-3462-2]|uniref:SGNH/GDSL hydrolase family protein n=1 Tax=Branchiibius sp. NY16-3462-2 TaxID=1807500 RepID=UPI00079A7E9A|nr:SGNH/GDSL hydrolase family protein [Branchiibius sp. NY16-3462-2]KYH45349.1 lipase [Branchiibius sp. NY16-3462-2]
MPRLRSIVLTTVIASVTGLGLVPTADAATVRYVALGDSYSSGVGAGSYLSSSGDCDRSTNAYSALWATANHPTSYVSVACSGAKTTDVLSNQVSALSSSTTLVSITIGGNDENFAGIMQDCNLKGTTTCVNEINAAKADATANLPGKLAKVYTAIKGKAPNAHVVVLGYPDFYDLDKSCIGLSQSSRTAIDSGIDLLDSLTKTAASKAGFTFGDVRSTFRGHEICDSGRWLHSVNLLDIEESYHPTATGQKSGYLPVFSAKA